MRSAQINHECQRCGKDRKRRGVGEGRIEHAVQADAVGTLGDAFQVRVRNHLQHCQRGREVGDGEIRAGQTKQRGEQEREQHGGDAAGRQSEERRRLQMNHRQREAIRAGAEKSDIAERQIAGEAVNDVQSLRQRHGDDEVEQQQMIAVDRRQDGKHRDHRQQDQEQVARDLRHGAPAAPIARSAAPIRSRSAARKGEDWPSC